MNRPSYPTDSTDLQWNVLHPLIPPAKPERRPRKTEMRDVINAIFYLLRTGYAFRLLPHDFPPWSTVCQWKTDGTWKTIHSTLHEKVRKQDGRESEESAAILDSQSVKTKEIGGPKVSMFTNKSKAENAIFSSIPWGSLLPSLSAVRMSRIVMGQSWSEIKSQVKSNACVSSGPGALAGQKIDVETFQTPS